MEVGEIELGSGGVGDMVGDHAAGEGERGRHDAPHARICIS
jgi:hypothetical protein